MMLDKWVTLDAKRKFHTDPRSSLWLLPIRQVTSQLKSISSCETHRAFLLLFGLGVLLLLVLPIKKTNKHLEDEKNIFKRSPLTGDISERAFPSAAPTSAGRFERLSPCPVGPSAPPPWPLCPSSPYPGAGARRRPCSAPPGDVSPLLSKRRSEVSDGFGISKNITVRLISQ